MRLIFEWDASKARENHRKHKVRFEEAKTVFNDPLQLAFPDDLHSEHEERCISIGLSANGRLLIVVHIEREDAAVEETTIRIISCRKATALERKTYEEG